MKQLLLLTTIALFSTSAFSQLNKNQFLVGGNVSFSASKYGGDDTYTTKYHQFEVSPNIGYFILDKIALGIRPGISLYKSEANYGTPFNYSSNSFTLSPFIRYYALKKNSKINFFGEADYRYMNTKEKSWNETLTTTVKRTNSGFSFMAGPAFFVNPSVALELSLSYTSTKYKDDNYRTNVFLAGLGLQVHLGNKKSKS